MEGDLENFETLKILFLEHHRHLSETKQKIQSLTQRVIGFLTLVTGWLILSKQSLPVELGFMLSIIILVIGVSSVVTLVRFNKSYRAESKVIAKINISLGLFVKGKFLDNDSLYPQSWKEFGSESLWFGLSHHLIAIFLLSVLAIITIFL